MIADFITALKNGSHIDSFKQVYPHDCEDRKNNFVTLAEKFDEKYEDTKNPIKLFSSPGRTEIGGNHTDHQRGRILAASVSMDNIAVVSQTDNTIIKVFSDEYGLSEVDVADLNKKEDEINTTKAIIRGVAARLDQLGYRIGGFNAFLQSNVPSGSGVSSSASFENLVVTILSSLYNDSAIDPLLCAQISQYAENEYFGKPSGLMDQAASSIGGAIAMDFKDVDKPTVEAVNFDLSLYDFSLCVVNTHSDHGDLTGDYAEIFEENKMVANYLGKDVLREVDEAEFYDKIPELRTKFGERAIVRAMHFFNDDARVPKQIAAIKSGNFDEFKKLVIESGISSMTGLQNIYSASNPKSQPMSLALEYSGQLLKPVGGAWRIHGGGFAGTIQAFVPNSFVPEYKEKMDKIFGAGSTQVIEIRAIGSTELKPNN